MQLILDSTQALSIRKRWRRELILKEIDPLLPWTLVVR